MRTLRNTSPPPATTPVHPFLSPPPFFAPLQLLETNFDMRNSMRRATTALVDVERSLAEPLPWDKVRNEAALQEVMDAKRNEAMKRLKAVPQVSALHLPLSLPMPIFSRTS